MAGAGKSLVNQAARVWLQQQQTIQQQGKVLVDEKYGLLLAITVREMEKQHEVGKISLRGKRMAKMAKKVSFLSGTKY